MRSVANERGVTLVEVMIVVVMVGILSTLAVVGYRRHVAASYTAEANAVIGGIGAAQQSYKAETGAYINVSKAMNNFYPASHPGKFTTSWGGDCAQCLVPWTRLVFKPSGPVIFGYATVASQSAIPPTMSSSSSGGPPHFELPGGGPDVPSHPIDNGDGTVDYVPDATGPYFTVTAEADTDGDGVYCTALYYSETNRIVFDQEGE
jgi:prepilin-type N-terminal cleavage/methylation domain-containing protein